MPTWSCSPATWAAARAIAWALRLDKPVLTCPATMSSTAAASTAGWRSCSGSRRARALQVCSISTRVHIDGVRFLGATLWTDFELFGEPQQRCVASRAEAQRAMRDFSRIRTREVGSELFTPDDAAAIFQRHAALAAARAGARTRGRDGGDHPSRADAAQHPPRFADSLLNACFVSDAERLLRAGRVALWCTGHTHDSFDHRVHGTRGLQPALRARR